MISVHLSGLQWLAPPNAIGGVPRYFTELFGALLAHQGIEPTAAAFGSPPPGGSTWGADAGGVVSRVRRSRQAPARAPQVLDRHFALFGPPARSIPLVTHFHGPWADESAAAGESAAVVAAKRAVERARYRSTVRFIVLSTAFAEVLVNRYGAEPDSITVIAPGVDLQRLTVAPESVGRPHVLCVRRLERRMGIEVLLRAWSQVRSHVTDAALTIVGTGSEEATLRRLTDQLGLTDSVCFRGAVSDPELTAFYASATLTVVPSVAWEGFGLVALESLARGRAPVVTDCGGLPDSVRGFADDLIVARGDCEALAHRIVDALNGARPTPAACRAQAQRFSWDKAADAHAAVYRSLVS